MQHTQILIDLWRRKRTGKSLSESEIKSIGRALFSLQRGLTGDRKLAGAGYMENQVTLGAYLLYYFPVTFEQISLALDAITFHPSNPSLQLLDIGSGPGPASAALIHWLKKKGFDPRNLTLTLIDSSEKALTLAREYFKAVAPTLTVKTMVANLEKFHPSTLKGHYDFTIASHVLNELWKNSPDALTKRENFVKAFSEKMSPAGIFLVSEPALLKTSRELISLIGNLSANGLSILAPCPALINNTHTCPIFKAGVPESASCHATVSTQMDKVVLAIAREAGLTRESVKMTFFALSKSLVQEYTSAPKRYRIVSDAMLNKSGRIRYLLCDGANRTALSAKENEPFARDQGFYSLTRYDTITLTNPEIRGDKKAPAFGMGPETTLSIERFAKAVHNKTKLLQAKSRQRHQAAKN